MKATIASLVQTVAQSVADRLKQPHQLDLTYITPRIMAMSECATAPIPTYDDDGRKDILHVETANSRQQQQQQQQQQQTPQPPPKKGNSPANLSTFLQNRRHEGHALLLSLSDAPPDDRLLLLLRRQVIHIPWASPGKERSETPSLPQLLELCYMIHAHLQLSPKNVILASCSNGKTRSAIVVACYLYFAGQVSTPLEGFAFFLSKRCPQLNLTSLMTSTTAESTTASSSASPPAQHNIIPPSLMQFFTNFHTVQSLGDFSNPKPLLLRAVALQGVPVDDKPCIDIWDAQQRHVYSSHRSTTPDDDSQWAEEEGFYRVNCVLEGDFCLLCRFGGVYADGGSGSDDDDDAMNDTKRTAAATTTYDPSKVLFRYANSAGFLSSGTWELPKQKVDMMRRYEAGFEEDDFLLTLILESYWDVAPQQQQQIPSLLQQDSKWLPPILSGYAALERGWQLLTQHHACRPTVIHDVSNLTCIFPEVRLCPPHICTVALQLTNVDLQGARNLLMDGPMKEWWNDPTAASNENDNAMQTEEDPYYDNDSTLEDDWPATGVDADHSNIRPVTPELTCQDVLDILDETDTPEAPPRAPLHINFERYYDQNRPNGRPSAASARTAAAVDDAIRYKSILFPNRGDVVDAFGNYSKDLMASTTNRDDTVLHRFPPVEPLRPRMPLHKRKRLRKTTAQRHKKQRHEDGTENNTQEEREAALKLLEQINHTGVTLDDLLQLQRNARHWMHPEDEEDDEEEELLAAALALSRGKAEVGELRKLKKRKSETEVDDDEDVDGFEVADENDVHGENERVLGFVVKGDEEEEQEAEKKPDDAIPLKDDPAYSKYFKMLKMGLPIGAVKNSITRDGKDPSMMDLDPEKSIKSQVAPPKAAGDDGPPIKEDPDYEKYFKMLKMGLPLGAVKNSITRDGKDPTVMDLDPNKSLKSQRGGDGDDGPPLKEDPDYEKYFKMLKMGLPIGAVKNSIARDGKDPTVMDLDPNKSLKSQQTSEEEEVDDGPPLKDDPNYSKYFKMLKMGLPLGAVKNSITRDGKDPSMMDLDPEKSIKSQTGGGGGGDEGAVDAGPPLKEDPDYGKYFKMLKMGLPIGAVKNSITRDGKDPTVMDLDPEKSIAFQRGGGDAKEEELVDTGPPLRDDPEYSKYFKMLKMGLPLGAVKNAVERDGKDASIMDMDQDKSIAFQLAKKKKGAAGGGPRSAGGRKKAKKRVRRKKIYWTPIDPKRVVEGSLWSMVKGVVDMETLRYDQTEFESLFTESTNPADKKKAEPKPGATSGGSKKKGSAQVIDGKRSMNGGIVLARLKLSYAKIADMVNIMDAGTFDSTQLKALKDFLPNDEELGQLKGYLPPAGTSKEEYEKAMQALPECEKYMIAMFDVKNAPAKFDAVLFKVGFQSLLDELVAGIDTLTKACNEVKSSKRLRKMMAMVLTLVNQINTGGDGNLALGFNLEALLKLGEAKAFDKKTSVLHYLVKLIRHNDKTLLAFKDDLKTLPEAVGVILDGLVGDMKVLNDQVIKVGATATAEADALEKEGKLPDMTSESSKVDGIDEDAKSEAGKEDEKGEAEKDKMEVDERDGGEEVSGDGPDDGTTDPSNQEEKKSSPEDMEAEMDGEEAESQTPRTPMELFTIKAKKDVDKALKTLGELKESYAGVLRYFGEDEKMASNDFFGTLQKFIKEFLKAADHVEKAERKMLKEKLKKAAKMAANMKLIGDVAKSGRKSRASAAELDASADNGDLPGKGKPDLGGLAVAAATAAAEKDKKKQGRPDLGSIGAMAAAAATQRKEKTADPSKCDLSIKERNEAPAGPPSMGGIAAMAAAAAVRKAKKQDTPDLGGIAVMAAAAASKRMAMPNTSKNEANEATKGPPNTGGIATMAAATAAKRGKEKQKRPDLGDVDAVAAAEAAKRNQDKQEPTGNEEAGSKPPSGGVVAAMAAAAAAARNRSKQEHPSTGGIAAMAAAAAAKRTQSNQEAPKSGGIAEAAALAASQRLVRVAESSNDSAENGEEMDSERNDEGGIVTMAAAAAAERSRSMLEKTNSGGIAAVAALAASQRQQIATDSSNDMGASGNGEEVDSEPPSGGGIAAMAAAAAAERNSTRQEAPNLGGIAAAAALAATQIKQRKAESSDIGADSGNGEVTTPEPFGGEGIAVMAAAAAAKRSRIRQETPNPGGIAAAAALAASQRQQRKLHSSDIRADLGSGEESTTEPLGGGGIAAMAAAAAAKHNRSRQETPNPGGIAAAAALAASQRQARRSESLNDPANGGNGEDMVLKPPDGSGIAAMAAAAAAKRNRKRQESQSSGDVAVVSSMEPSERQQRNSESLNNATDSRTGEEIIFQPLGGGSIAAMEGAAAAKGNQSRQETPNPGSIAAAAALAASERQMRMTGSSNDSADSGNDEEIDFEPLGGGDIAAMAAAAAAKRNRKRLDTPNIGGNAMATSLAGRAESSNNKGASGRGDEMDCKPLSGSDIATMAAAAAAKRNRSRQETPNIGGIAAAAALAASQRQLRRAESSNHAAASGNGEEATPEPIGGTNLAAMAAAAAVNRKAPNPGGIATAAAMAASQRQARRSESSNRAATSENGDEVTSEELDEGGITAMAAAAAAAKRNQSRQEVPNPGSIAAAAAMAQLNLDGLADASVASHVTGDAHTEPKRVDGVGDVTTNRIPQRILQADTEEAKTDTDAVNFEAALAYGVKESEVPQETLYDDDASISSIFKELRHMDASGRDSLRRKLEPSTSRQALGTVLDMPLPEENSLVLNTSTGAKEVVQDTHTGGSGPGATAGDLDLGLEATHSSREEVSALGGMPDNVMDLVVAAGTAPEIADRILDSDEMGLVLGSIVRSPASDLEEVDLEEQDLSEEILDLVKATEKCFAEKTSEASDDAEYGRGSPSEYAPDAIAPSSQGIEERSATTAKKRSSFDNMPGDDDSSSAGESTSSKKQKSSPATDFNERNLPLNPDTTFPMDLDEEIAQSFKSQNDASMEFDVLEKGNTERDVFLDSVQGEIAGFLNDIAKTEVLSDDDTKSKESFATAESKITTCYETNSVDDLSTQGNPKKKKSHRGKKKKKKSRKKASRQEASVGESEQMSSLASLQGAQTGSTHALDRSLSLPRRSLSADLTPLHQEQAFPMPVRKTSLAPSKISLSPLQAERSSARARTQLASRTSETFESFMDTLNDEVNAVSGDGVESVDRVKKPDRPEEQQQQQQLDEYFSQSDGTDTPVEENSKMAQIDSTTHPTQESSTSSDDENISQGKSIEEKEKQNDEKIDGKNPFQRFLGGLGGSSKDSGLAGETRERAAPESPSTASEHGKHDSPRQNSSGHSEDSPSKGSPNGFQRFFRHLGGSASALPMEPPAPAAKIDSSPGRKSTTDNKGSTSSQHSNPFSSFMQSLSIPSLDSKTMAMQAIEKESLTDVGLPSLSNDDGVSQGSKDDGDDDNAKTKEESEAEMLQSSMSNLVNSNSFFR